MSVSVVSFGFKHGTPLDADMIIDVRFLANPYFVPELREKSGESDEVRAFVIQHRETRRFFWKNISICSII